MGEIKVYDVRVQKGDSAFLIDDGTTAILYDSGFGFTGFQIADQIQVLLKQRKLDYIFLTHSHYDHALASPYILEKYPNAKVVAGRYAAEIFKRPGAIKTMKELDAAFAAECGIEQYPFLGDKLRVDIPCDDGDVIQAGTMQFRVINLPGHTKCSVGYYCPDYKLFLSTETLGVYDGDALILPSYLVSYQSALSSIQRVKNLEIDMYLAPHYGLLNPKQKKFFLDHMEYFAKKSAEEILDQIQKGLTPQEIFENFKNQYWHGVVKEFYPIEAMRLNTSIMIHLLQKECMPSTE